MKKGQIIEGVIERVDFQIRELSEQRMADSYCKKYDTGTESVCFHQ